MGGERGGVEKSERGVLIEAVDIDDDRGVSNPSVMLFSRTSSSSCG